MNATMPTLATPRLNLRPLSLADAGDLFTLRGDPLTMRYWDWPADDTVEATREMARRFIAEAEAGVSLYMSARLADGAYVGLFDLSELDRPAADLGFMTAPRFWGRGLAAEGARAMVGEARRRGASGLTARAHADNAASRRLLLRLGFQTTGEPRSVEIAPARFVLCDHFRLELGVR